MYFRDNVPKMRIVFTSVIAGLVLVASSCTDRAASGEIGTYMMGEKAQVGSLIYTVVDSQWAISLGEPPAQRIPADRFLMVNISVVNSGKDPISVPTFTLTDASGKSYPELGSGEGVPNWMGVFRKVAPAEASQGIVLFDVPQKEFKLRVADDSDQRYAMIRIPLVLGEPGLNKPAEPPAAPRETKP
jgi:hypothetical protein